MEILSQLTAVGAVFALLGGTLWWLRRRGIAGVPRARARKKKLECLERLPLGPQHALHLIRLGKTGLLVASSPGGCALVRSFTCSEMETVGEAER